MRWQDFKLEDWKREYEGWKQLNQPEPELSGCTDLEEVLDKTKDYVHPPFRPHALYNEDGDQIEVYLSDSAYYAKYLTPQITVLLDVETNEVVGIEICGIQKLIKKV